MPFYPFNAALPLGTVLREGLDDLRSGRYKLAHVVGNLQQMSNQQIADAFGFADATVAGNAATELLADIQKLLSDEVGVNSAVVQMLNQFG